ncbi:MAG TPA: chorismate mutase [Actinomycetota bacterium]
MLLRAVRGAITLREDTVDEVISATSHLIEEMLSRNELSHDDLVSIMFTATPDVRSEFPAAAARKIGISDVPLICATEIDVAGAPSRCIRVMMHVYTDRDRSALHHVYLGDARQLRTDLPE